MIKSNAFWNSLSKNRPTLVLKIWNFTTQLTLLHSVAPFMFQNCTKMSHKQCTLCYAYYVGNDNHGKNRSESHTYSRILTKFPNFKHQKTIYTHLGAKIKKSKRSVFKFDYKTIAKIKQWNKNVVKTLSVLLCTEQ